MNKKYKIYIGILLFVFLIIFFNIFFSYNPYKQHRTIYTTEMLKNAQINCQNEEWAMTESKEYIKKGDEYLQYFDFIYESIASQDVPRSYAVSVSKNDVHNQCPYCHMDLTSQYGNYPWIINQQENPWKIKCPECSVLFPTNDYESYYKSGLDEKLIFHKELANEEYLKNVSDDPNIKKLGETWGVDDGFGFKENDEKYTFIAYYNHWGNWINGKNTIGLIQDSLNTLNMAYIYTGDEKYSNAGIILLYKISLIYPQLDTSVYSTDKGFYNNSSYNSKGIAVGSIWECSLLDTYICSYDLFFESAKNKNVLKFLDLKSNDIFESIEENIFNTILANVQDVRIFGNFPFHQSVLVEAAILLNNDYGNQLLNFAFENGEVKNYEDGTHKLTGGNLENILYTLIDVDGFGDEVAPEYNSYAVSGLIEIANLLKSNNQYNLLDSGKFKLVVTNFKKMILENHEEIQLGDSGFTGFGKFHLNIDDYISIFENTQDIDYLSIIDNLVNELNIDEDKLHYSIFHDDPSFLKKQINTLESNNHHYNFNLSDFGLSSISNGNNQIYMYYGNGQKHGHKDMLNFGIIEANNDLSPDLGYPTYADENARRIAWESNSLSHNTVIVNGMNQNNQKLETGYMEYYSNNDKVNIMKANAPFIYENINKYERSLISVNLSYNNTMDYLIDAFEINSDKENEYLYSFHGFNNSTISNKCKTINQLSNYGNYDSQNSWNYKGSGFNYLKNYRETFVNSTQPIIWEDQSEDKFLAMLPLNHQNVYLAEGPKPLHPENQKTGKNQLTYAFLKESTKNAKFHNIYITNKKILDLISKIDIIVNDQNSSVYRIEFKNNRTDYLIFSNNQNTIKTSDFSSKCEFGLISFVDGDLKYSYVNNGKITIQDDIVQSDCIEGRVIDYEKQDLYNPEITIQLEENIDNKNKYIYFKSQNGTIKEVDISELSFLQNNLYKLNILNKSLISAKENNNFIYWIYKDQNVYFKIPGILDKSD